VIALDYCRNTREEAERFRESAREHGWRRILLVTSATHMRRAVATFETAGFEVIPVPCNFISDFGSQQTPFRLSVPSAGGLSLINIWLHEEAGCSSTASAAGLKSRRAKLPSCAQRNEAPVQARPPPSSASADSRAATQPTLRRRRPKVRAAFNKDTLAWLHAFFLTGAFAYWATYPARRPALS
jgi:hypothetical protein